MKKGIFLVWSAFVLLALAGCAVTSGNAYGDTWAITKTSQLTNSTAWEGSPVWDDYGTRLFYTSNEFGNFDVWMMNADGTNKTQITNESADEFPLFRWSDNLIYVSKQFGSSNLWIISNLWSLNASDVEKIALTNDSYWNTDPALIYVPVPQIYDMQPSDTIGDNVPLISAIFSCSFGNVSKVNISVDAVNVTQNATITDSYVSYIPTTPLDCGIHNFTVRVESDRYTYGYGFQFFTITYITNPTPTGAVYTSTPTISADISCGYGNVSLVTISVDEIDVTPNATITPSYVSYTPTIPLSNGTHNVMVYVESTKGVNDSKSWTFVVNPEYPPCPPGGGGRAVPYPYAPKIIFASNRSGNFDIWMINPDGIGLQQLTFDSSNEYSPVGIGSKIVYVPDNEGNKDICVMNNDGSNKERLTSEPSNEYDPEIIDSKIVYISDQSGNEDIWLMCEDGSNKERLTFSTVDKSMPSWSPIGGIIYAARTGVNADYDLWMMNTNGTGKTQLTDSTLNETNPVFSPSPYRLGVAYVTEQDDDANIWITDFTESGDNVRIWSLEDGYALVCRWADDEGALLSLGRDGKFVDHEYVWVEDTFSLPRYGSQTITGTVNSISTFENGIFEVEVVDVTQCSDTGEVLISNATKILTNALIPLKIGTLVFDTGAPANPYPSIMGNHTGTIKPNHTVIATKLYTYPCVGTGGHTEYAEIWNATWNATATWNGYAGDWHNISFDKTVVLLAGESYNYTIRTGSYPQIIHESPFNATGGTITCDKFIDANGRIYYDWIPAIKLFL